MQKTHGLQSMYVSRTQHCQGMPAHRLHHTGPMRQDSAARILQGDITPSFQPSVVALHYRHPLSSLLPIHQTPVYDSRVEDTEFQQGLKSHCHWHTRETN